MPTITKAIRALSLASWLVDGLTPFGRSPSVPLPGSLRRSVRVSGRRSCWTCPFPVLCEKRAAFFAQLRHLVDAILDFNCCGPLGLILHEFSRTPSSDIVIDGRTSCPFVSKHCLPEVVVSQDQTGPQLTRTSRRPQHLCSVMDAFFAWSVSKSGRLLPESIVTQPNHREKPVNSNRSFSFCFMLTCALGFVVLTRTTLLHSPRYNFEVFGNSSAVECVALQSQLASGHVVVLKAPETWHTPCDSCNRQRRKSQRQHAPLPDRNTTQISCNKNPFEGS